jgi:hypothetical protein
MPNQLFCQLVCKQWGAAKGIGRRAVQAVQEGRCDLRSARYSPPPVRHRCGAYMACPCDVQRHAFRRPAGVFLAHCASVTQVFGLYCAGVELATIQLVEGYWRSSNRSDRFMTCRVAGVCKGGNDSQAYCKGNHDGQLCEVCEASAAPRGPSSCCWCAHTLHCAPARARPTCRTLCVWKCGLLVGCTWAKMIPIFWA